MATFFGEVILPSSRAFWDDRDDSDQELEQNDKCPKLEVTKTTSYEEKLQYELLIIVDGPVSSSFASNYLLSESCKLLSTLETPSQNDDPVENLSFGRRVKWQAALLYLLKDKTLLLQTNASRPIDIWVANEITLFVSSWLKRCKKVVVLCSRPISEFKYDRSSGVEMPDSIIRFLSSSVVTTSGKIGNAPRLEQPNFVTGVSASVLSWCEVKKIECLLYVCYSDSVFYNSASMSPLLDLFMGESSFAHLVTNKNPDMTNHLPNSHLTSLYF